MAASGPTAPQLQAMAAGPQEVALESMAVVAGPSEVTVPAAAAKAADLDSPTTKETPGRDSTTAKGSKEEGEEEAAPEAKAATGFSALKPFVIISVSYLLYTTTDGAIRMIVLLNAYNLGFTAWEVALMFTAYELAGVFTNLAAGMMGAKWGLKNTLLTGLCLQLVGISVLYAWQDSWSEPGMKWKAILFVTFAQMLCGIAKDLTKLGGKTVTKLVTPDEKQSRLFKLVSLITGWKNSLKGVGYFIGAACLSVSYQFALGILLLLIVLAMPWAIIGLSNKLGRARSKNLALTQIFRQKYNVNVLSISRYFLFGARDMWFEVPLPFFLRDAAVGLGWSRPLTGLFLALWIIIYGQVQSWTPQTILEPLRQSPANSLVALMWCGILVVCPVFMGGMVQSSSVFADHDVQGMAAVMIAGLAAFCLVFAVNSSVHSYLIVKYADGDKVALNIGFYYMANAMGRLTGTLVSGAMYSYIGPTVLNGFAACFWASAGFATTSAAVDFFLHDGQQGLKLGPCLTLVAPTLDLPTTSKQDSDASDGTSAQKLGDKAAPPAFSDKFESQQLSTYLSGVPTLKPMTQQPPIAEGVQEGTGKGQPAAGPAAGPAPAPASPGEVTLVMASEPPAADAGAQQKA